jgi:hypothetical protein
MRAAVSVGSASFAFKRGTMISTALARPFQCAADETTLLASDDLSTACLVISEKGFRRWIVLLDGHRPTLEPDT